MAAPKGEKHAREGDLVVWKDAGEQWYAAGLVHSCNLRGRAIEAKIPTPDGWRVYPVFGSPRIASAGTIRNLETLVQHAPLFDSLKAAQEYFAPYRS